MTQQQKPLPSSTKWTEARIQNEITDTKYKSVSVISTGVDGVIEVQCDCERIFKTTPYRLFLRKCGCKPCGNKKDPLWTIEKLRDILTPRNIEILEYGELHTRETIKMRCTTCLYEWERSINKTIHRNHGCSVCSGRGIKWTSDRVTEMVDKRPFKIIGELKIDNGAFTKIPLECDMCSHQWSARLQKIRSGTGCPQCSLNGIGMQKDHIIPLSLLYENKYRRKNNPYVDIYLHKLLSSTINIQQISGIDNNKKSNTIIMNNTVYNASKMRGNVIFLKECILYFLKIEITDEHVQEYINIHKGLMNEKNI